MDVDARGIIIDICRHNGNAHLIRFFKDYSYSDQVDMLIDSGYGEHLLEWFREEYPEDFEAAETDTSDREEDDRQRTADLRREMRAAI